MSSLCRVATLVLLGSAILVGCGDDTVPSGGGGNGGASPGGHGGGGGTPFTMCSSCVAPDAICVDDARCAATCPTNRVACDGRDGTAAPNAWDICCASGEQCCPGMASSYCAPAGTPCPTLCPDGSTCPGGELCTPDPVDGTFSCVADCSTDLTCGDVCCALGSKCVDGQCPLPDISIDGEYLTNTLSVELVDFSDNSCSFQEGCIGATGQRKLLRFSLKTPNTGEGDLFLGDPFGNDLFEYSPCHDHYHFKGYAEYRLLDANDVEVAYGHKQAFCLLDYAPLSQGAPAAQYDCQFQGISAGWSDIYESNLPCQWVDVTDVAAGTYKLVVRLNYEHTLIESDYTNNEQTFNLEILPESCPQGCREVDPMCCAAGDPCGWGSDGSCDCGGFYDWDAQDCSYCLSCEPVTTCTGGCTLASDPCCDAANSCGLAGNDVCDCEGTQMWDEADCTSCISSDPECANVNTCPNGCSSFQSQPQCCGAGDPCGYANDGWCDCSGQSDWDVADCTHCTTPGCPN